MGDNAWRHLFLRVLLLATLLGASGRVGAQELRLPFDGRWFVVQGGDTLNVNHHMNVRAQWFGIDFAKVGPRGRELSTEAASRLEDFYSWGSPVLAPVAGDVVEVVDGLPDNRLGDHDVQRPFGNHVVIRAAPDRFVFLAHLQRGSVLAKVGQRVRPGDRLGLCGSSGNSDFPHVHLHVQDSLDMKVGRGQNPAFANIDVELTEKRFARVTWPLIRGLFVAPSASSD